MTEEEMQRIQDIIEEIQFEHSEEHFNMLKDKINWLIKENRKGWEIVDIAIKERDHYIAERDALQARIDGALGLISGLQTDPGEETDLISCFDANDCLNINKAIEILKGEQSGE